MKSPMMEIFAAKDRRERSIAMLWSAFFGIILVGIFVALGLMAIDSLPDPKATVTYSVTTID
jgi:uncharacterized membrane protein